MADLGFEMSLEIKSDSSAARAFASWRGLGRQRHVQTRYLWIQERVAAGHLSRQKFKTTQNIVDILTEAASRETSERRKRTLGLRDVNAHSSQKELRLVCMEHSHPLLACALSSDQVKQFSCDKLSQSHIWYDINKKRSGSDVSYWMQSRRERGACLEVGRVLRTREGD